MMRCDGLEGSAIFVLEFILGEAQGGELGGDGEWRWEKGEACGLSRILIGAGGVWSGWKERGALRQAITAGEGPKEEKAREPSK